ncbi:hypothetical protein EUTSA_v10026404mg [Eutrema salsugineum]|uniref:Uncharacterized protein n=1 Tax=Eutrema salsugineum TaxID=72664 RepID=V4MJ57_EUTSA|nr:uncharacterized protein LOC18029155 [Eutrema salsugineum]ESQ55432.1 hypothetical protein EUTSA_v10026404mg [Eutrema salsugineum]
MATKFIILTQVNRSKISVSTRKPPRCNRNKPRPSKSISENMLNNVFPGKALTEIYHNSQNSDPLTNSLLNLENQSVKEEERRSQQEHGKVSSYSSRKDGKSISTGKYEDMRREVARLSLLWYMKSSISFILRRARAFYNEFCCDTYVASSTMVVVDPYFSVPVLPFNSLN